MTHTVEELETMSCYQLLKTHWLNSQYGYHDTVMFLNAPKNHYYDENKLIRDILKLRNHSTCSHPPLIKD